MTKRKLDRFAELNASRNAIQPTKEEIQNNSLPIKGNWGKDFFCNANPIVLELGCGKGEYTVGLGRKYPNKNFIGVDIKGARMWRGSKIAAEENLSNVGFLRTNIEFIARCFAPGEVSEIWLTFPDPQIKKLNKRLSSARFLNYYKEISKPNVTIHLKTDSELLHGFTLDLTALNKLKVNSVTANLYADMPEHEAADIQTFYESTYLKRNIPITYLQFELNNTEEIINPEEDEARLQKEITERLLTSSNRLGRN